MRQHDRQRGFTLLELLLVLAVIVTMIGLAWPALRGSLGSARLHDAAKQVRVELSRTRLAAMEADAVYELQYSRDSGSYRVRRMLDLNPAAEGEECALPAETDAWDDTSTSSDQGGLAGWAEFSLPEGVVFAAAALAADERTVSTDAPLEVDAPLDWSEPIVFFPDGTTSTAEVVLRNDRGDELVITLRGLTGVSQIAEEGASERLVR